MLVDPMPGALIIAEFFIRTLAPEWSRWGAVPSLWGLWALAWWIAQFPPRSKIAPCSLGIGLLTGLISSAHPFAVALSYALAAHITYFLTALIRLPPLLSIAAAGAFLSFFCNVFYWAALALTGALSLKMMTLGYLLEFLPRVSSHRAFCDFSNTACAISLCQLLSRRPPSTFRSMR